MYILDEKLYKYNNLSYPLNLLIYKIHKKWLDQENFKFAE